MEPREVRKHFNCVISFVQEGENEDISAYYDHLRRLRDLIAKVMCTKPLQKKTETFFKSVSTATIKPKSPRTSCPKTIADDM
jgi:hypothetical protein